MRIVVAPDSFKGSLTALEVAQAVAAGWKQAQPDAVCVLVPLADGGEGTVKSLVDATNGSLVSVQVSGPFGQPTTASYGLLGETGTAPGTAVIEMAAASGLHLRTDPKAMSPFDASSFGTGQLIKDALDRGVRTVVLGLGGSATNDGGAGMLSALGVRLLDARGSELKPGGGHLQHLESIDLTQMHPAVEQCDFQVASDVTNPLCGPSGATAVFGPQKGVGQADIAAIDAGLEHFAKVARASGAPDVSARPGAGAAGGLGFAALSFLHANLRPGIEVVIDAVGLRAALDGADLLITGEGRIDRQTLAGKVPFGAMRAAQAAGVPAIAIVGSIGPGANEVIDAGMAGIFSIVNAPMELSEALAATESNLRHTARSIAGVWGAAHFLPKP